MLEPPTPRHAPPSSLSRRCSHRGRRRSEEEEWHGDTVVFPGARTPTPSSSYSTHRTVTTITDAALYPEPATGHAPTLPPPSRPRSARHARAHDALSAHGPRHDSSRTHAITPRGSPTACGHTHKLRTPTRTRPCCTHATRHGSGTPDASSSRPYTSWSRPTRHLRLICPTSRS